MTEDGTAASNVCGYRNLPLANQSTDVVFLKYVNFDPLGPDHWRCPVGGGTTVGLTGSDNAAAAAASGSTGGAGPPTGGDARDTAQNDYTFVGSYYHVYVRLASCPAPTGKLSSCSVERCKPDWFLDPLSTDKLLHFLMFCVLDDFLRTCASCICDR